jgi:hypothetical protein
MAAYHHDDVYWDPGLTATGTGSGGSGSFDGTTVNFYNPRLAGDRKIFIEVFPGTYPENIPGDADHPAPGYDWTADMVHFATTGGTVTVTNPTDIGLITFDVGGYTINGAAITLGGGYGNHFDNPDFILTSTTGNNTINAPIYLGGAASAVLFNGIHVAAGTLTLGDVTNGTAGGYSYNNLRKTGAGTLIMNGNLNLDTQAFSGLFVDAGTMLFNTPPASGGATFVPGNSINQSVEVASGAAIGGNGGLRINGAQADYNNGSLPHFTILAGGHLAPGNNPAGSNFGAVGTFTLRGGYGNGQTSLAATLKSLSNLDIDIASLSSYDSFQLTGGEYNSGKTFTIENGAKININAINPLSPGTYHIITETASALGTYFAITDGGFTVNGPSGFSYSIVDLPGDAGIDLVIAALGAATDATWQTNVDGNWSTGANWLSAVPDSPGSTARFTGNTTGSVNVDGTGRTVGRILITGATNYTISGQPITLNNTGGTGTNMVISSDQGTQVISSNIVTTAGTVDVTVNAGSLRLGGVVSGPAAMTKAGAGTLLLNGTSTGYTSTITVNAGTLGGSGTVGGTVAAGSGAHTIAPSATLASTTATKLTVGGLTTNNNTTLAFNLVTRNIAGGSDQIDVTGAGGLTLGAGTKIAITGNPVGAGSLGYYQALKYNGTFNGAYNSTAISMPAVSAGKIAYTLDIAHDAGFIDIHRGFLGDADDNGVVNFTDFVRLSNNYGKADKGWFGGDFNGDGTTNFSDFVQLSNNYGNTVGGGSIVVSPDELAVLSAFGAAAADAVPEPASLSLLAVGALALLNRRKRR